MSKNVSIKEGGVSRVFNNVEKLVTNDTSNGTDTWVPLDEVNDYADTTELTVVKNGTYEAPTAGVAGYKKVTVNVPSTAGTIDEGNIVESLITNITNFLLLPKIYMTSSGWEWTGGRQEGEPIRTFQTSNTAKVKDSINIAENHFRLYQNRLVEPSNYSDIEETDTALAYFNNKQLYFVSISDFTKGITDVSPRVYNPTITPYVEDMYKCRRLKYVEGGTRLITDLYLQSGTAIVGNETIVTTDASLTMGVVDVGFNESAAEKTMAISFRATNGNNYGWRTTENKTSGDVAVKIIRNNLVFEDIAARFYESAAAAEADIGIVPPDTIALIRPTGGGS